MQHDYAYSTPPSSDSRWKGAHILRLGLNILHSVESIYSHTHRCEVEVPYPLPSTVVAGRSALNLCRAVSRHSPLSLLTHTSHHHVMHALRAAQQHLSPDQLARAKTSTPRSGRQCVTSDSQPIPTLTSLRLSTAYLRLNLRLHHAFCRRPRSCAAQSPPFWPRASTRTF